MLDGLSYLNMCDDSRVMVSMDRQNEYCSDVVMFDGKNEWLKQIEVSIIGIQNLSHDLENEVVCQTKYCFSWCT